MESKTAFWVFLAAIVVVFAAVGISYAYNSSITGNETERGLGSGEGNGLRDGSGSGRGGGSCGLGDNVSGEAHVCTGSGDRLNAGESGCTKKLIDGSGCTGCALKGTASCTGGCQMNSAADTNAADTTGSGCGCLGKIS